MAQPWKSATTSSWWTSSTVTSIGLTRPVAAPWILREAKVLPAAEIAKAFDLKEQLRNVDAVFKRVFSA